MMCPECGHEWNPSKTVEVINEKKGHHQISLGNIHFKTSLLNESNSALLFSAI